MMAIRQYTRSELISLRDSPLVQKPENLPAIEQWIDESQQPHSTGGRRQPHSKAVSGGDASPMGNFSAGVRPSLISRTTASKSEDISLGPPRTMFPSSRNTAKLSDFDKTDKTPGDGKDGDEQEAPRSRIFGEKVPRKSVGERDGRDNRESWTSARERRAQGGDDEPKHEGRYHRRERDPDGERRNGFGEKHDGRWGERRQNGDRQGGWREREREKKEKDSDKGIAGEKEPEWMDDPAPASAEDDLRTMGMPRNQEQFQKWKEAMSGKKPQTEDPEGVQAEPLPVQKDTAAAKPIAPLKLEGIVDKPFGGWGDVKSQGNAMDGTSTTAKSAPGKGKASRFASMFKESQPKEEAPPEESKAPQLMNAAANGTAEDEAGFKRILQMLGGTGIGQPAPPEGPSSPPARTISNGAKQKSRFTGFFEKTPKSPERMQSPPEDAFNSSDNDRFQGARGIAEESSSMFGGRLPDGQSTDQASRSQIPRNMMSPEMPMNGNGNREQQSQPGRMNDIFLDQRPPSRGAATPDVNIQNLLASQRAQKPQGQDKNSEFLLNLLQTKGGSRPSSQQARGDNFSLWLDQPPGMPEPHAPKPRAPPPSGFIDDHLLRNAPPDPPRPDQSMLERRTSQRAPPGFFDEQGPFMQHQQQPPQRRNFTEPPQHPHHLPGRRMANHPHPNLPPMQIPQQSQQFPGGLPPEFMQSPLSGQGPPGPQAPPPGFNPHMPRHPPGFHNIPNIFQPPQGVQQQQRNDMPNVFSGGMGGGSGGGMASPPNAPPGFFGGPGVPGMPPPGFMGMRSPNDVVPANAAPLRGGGRGYDSGGYDAGMGGPRR